MEEGKYVKISVKDQGIGIPEEDLSKIFDPYFTTKAEGSGLGLAITYSIIKKHEGHISVKSKVGTGTTFYTYFPVTEKESLVVESVEEEKIFAGKGRVLFMDDQIGIKNMVGKMLKHIGYEVEFAKDGAEALELYKKKKDSEESFDVVILDLTIPGGMGGKEVIQKIHEIDPEVKAIVSSGYSNDPVMSNFKEYGFSGVVSKPYEIKKLSEVLHKIIKSYSTK